MKISGNALFKKKKTHIIKHYLVGGIPTPLKNMTSSVGVMTFPTEWKNKKWSKPPTSNVMWVK
jgi:hypothetical protein